MNSLKLFLLLLIVCLDKSPKPLMTQHPKPLMTQQPDVGLVYTGESVTYECKVDVSSGWKYHWFKDGSEILNGSSQFFIHNAAVTESGRYRCMASRNQAKYKTEQSDERVLTISVIPVPSLENVSNWLDVFPTEDVKLSCGMTTNRTHWKYTWYKDGKEFNNDVSFDLDRTNLSISHASHSHRGRYSCMGKLKARPVSSSFSSELTLKVYGEIHCLLFKNSLKKDI
uniref:Ig-like domain-containing protein n=1 Tax=Anabas testudineus TaxID=64144 RepID=A0A7N5ZV09_ANATE